MNFNEIFDTVATDVISYVDGGSLKPEAGIDILETLVRVLRNQGWTTVSTSFRKFEGSPIVYQAMLDSI